MDKADDFILGGLTEGVNALGQITGGTNEAPQNPFSRIFIDDYDYQGTRLMAAAGNAMANLDSNNIWSRGGEVRIPAGARVGLSNIDAAKNTVSFGRYVDQLAKQNGWGQ
jgi:hypothetical protein